MGLTLGATGKLMLRNGKLFTDENGYDCCCGGLDCCNILQNFAELIVTGDIVGNPIGGPGVCWTGEVDPGTGAEFTAVSEFSICCVEVDGVSKFRVSFTIASSAPCDQTFTQDFEILQPCCPVDQELVFTGVDVACQSSGTITIRIQTDPGIECPSP